jgi:opacity protein-like surface antigen
MSIQRVAKLASMLAALFAAASACAADVGPAAANGFYGGIALRDNGSEQQVAVGETGNPWNRLTPAIGEPSASQALMFGGYRWRNELALEAAIAHSEGYRLPGRGGVGLMIPALSDATPRSWNVDVFGSWSFWRTMSLYGRLGYAQSEATPIYSTSIAGGPIERRAREGLNYGVGLRYDVTRSLGLKLEYARVGAPLGESPSLIPEVDQVQFGLQFRF